MSEPIYRPARRVDPRTGLAFKSGAGDAADRVSDSFHRWKSRRRDRWFEASFNNSTPKNRPS